MARISTHITETKSKNIFSSIITGFSSPEHSCGDLLFREISERDYGVDGQVELFNHGEPTGRIAMIQLKATEKAIHRLKNAAAVSCHGISKSNLSYCRQRNVPVILVYCSNCEGKFYYIDLQSVFQERIEAIADNFSGTVRIPVSNNSDDLSVFVKIINSYYDRISGIVSDRMAEKKEKFSTYEKLIDSYVFKLGERPADGEHREIGANGETIAVGLWKGERLLSGTEFNFLIHIENGSLIKKDNPEDPYDPSDNFEYSRLEQYGWYTFDVFAIARNYIIENGLDGYYVVDFDVTEDTEQMKNIRTLKEFLEVKEPEWLDDLLDEMEEK